MNQDYEKNLYQCLDLSFSYEAGAHNPKVLENINLDIDRGDFVGLSGPSGSGKSTLLNLMGLIEPPQHGTLKFRGLPVNSLSEKDLNLIRKFHIGFIFQDFQLIDVLNVEENVEYFLTRQGVPYRERRTLVQTALNEVGLWEHRKKRPTQLSGGQKQRVAIARSLSKRPSVIIADEPTASLDLNTGRSIMEVLKEMNERHQVTIVLASHDGMVLEYVKREVKLRDGRIEKIEEGKRHVS